MEVELRKAPASYRMSMLSRVRNYKQEVEQLSADVVGYSMVHFFVTVIYEILTSMCLPIFGMYYCAVMLQIKLLCSKCN